MERIVKNQKSLFILSIIIFTLIFLVPKSILALGLHTISDRLNRQAPSTPSDHEIKFTTPSGIGETGQYLRISFDSGFDLSAITINDIDLTHGPVTGTETNLVLAALPSATSWGVNISGTQIEFTHPTNSVNGDILPGDKVISKIGLNAGGTQQIINPATIGSKIIAISGNFGDSGKLATAIFADQIGVGGQTENAPPNPVILNFPVNITSTSMHLSWSQNIDFDFDRYEFYYGDVAGLTNFNGILLISTNDHSAVSYTLSGLSSAKDYYFVVYVYDTEGNSVASNEVFGRTLGGATVLPPIPVPPTLDMHVCPIFVPQFMLSGTKPQGTIIFVNGDPATVLYPDDLSWNYWAFLNIGNNPFIIFDRDYYGQDSTSLVASISRCEVGDTNCNTQIDDFDLAGLAFHWQTSWCYADFNADGLVDDFDLSGLAAHWNAIF